MNALLPLPALPRRLAVISSPTAAGWRDFTRQLQEKGSGYHFEVQLFPALMQGAEAPASIIAALDAVAAALDADATAFDAVLILRGGGGAMDLVCFDDYELAVNVAQFPLPVLTGIGHDHDYHVVDQVAHTSVKTPTALADWLVERFDAEAWRLDTLLQRLHLAIRTHATAQMGVLEAIQLRMAHAVQRRFSDAAHRLDVLESRIDAANPQRALERGYLIALKNGRRAARAADFTPGDRLSLLFLDGIVEAEVKKRI